MIMMEKSIRQKWVNQPISQTQGAWWLSGRASDSESRGPGFDSLRLHCVVSLSKTH